MSFVASVIAASSGSPPPPGPARRDPDERAREILAERYAQGELTTDEYRERIGELR